MKILFPLLAISAALLGCSSTPKVIERHELPIVNNQAAFPPLNILSENIYQWDESISEALNIAKLAQPAGVANDIWDETDGKTVRIDRTGMGGRVVDGLIGFAIGGAMGALSLDNLNKIKNEQVEWKPSIIELVDKNEFSVDGGVDFRKVRAFIAKKVRDAIRVDYPDLALGEALSYKYPEYKPRLVQLVLDDNMCLSLNKHQAIYKDRVQERLLNLSDAFYDGKNEVVNVCGLVFELSASKETDDGKIAIVAELLHGFLVADTLINNYDGYVIVPDIYFINSRERVTHPYAYVSKSGKELLFQKP